MTTSIITPQIASFAEAVRDALHDLPAEEREELTDGLEADLAEAYAEDLERELPDPAEYATELRNAAGLPEGEPTHAGIFAALATSIRRTQADLASGARNNPALAPVAAFLAAIHPLWWVVRAWVAAWLVAAFFGSAAGVLPTSASMTLVLLVLVVVSVQWGRGRWTFRGLAPIVVIGNVMAIVLLPFVVTIAASWNPPVDYAYAESELITGGLSSRGEAVRNVFAYDAEGKPLSDVQLFDQDGRPLEVLLDPVSDECFDGECRTGYRPDGTTPRPARLVTGASVFNVFPLSMLSTSYAEFGETQVDPEVAAAPPVAPFPQVPAVDGIEQRAPQKVAPSNE